MLSVWLPISSKYSGISQGFWKENSYNCNLLWNELRMGRFERASTYSCRQSTQWLDFPGHRQPTCLKVQDLNENRMSKTRHWKQKWVCKCTAMLTSQKHNVLSIFWLQCAILESHTVYVILLQWTKNVDHKNHESRPCIFYALVNGTCMLIALYFKPFLCLKQNIRNGLINILMKYSYVYILSCRVCGIEASTLLYRCFNVMYPHSTEVKKRNYSRKRKTFQL